MGQQPQAASRLKALDPASTRIDNEYYGEVGDAWWDPRGPLRGLHEMNPARAGYVDKAIMTALGMPPRPQTTVLDVGCGGGILSEELAGRGYRVTGIDAAQGAIDAAKRHASAGGLAIDYRVGSAY
jgi:2-polyprenyl-6-hydroxyphenyl methylase / 3-demethylubiquinone-9 3-methyltransferase